MQDFYQILPSTLGYGFVRSSAFRSRTASCLKVLPTLGWLAICLIYTYMYIYIYIRMCIYIYVYICSPMYPSLSSKSQLQGGVSYWDGAISVDRNLLACISAQNSRRGTKCYHVQTYSIEYASDPILKIQDVGENFLLHLESSTLDPRRIQIEHVLLWFVFVGTPAFKNIVQNNAVCSTILTFSLQSSRSTHTFPRKEPNH